MASTRNCCCTSAFGQPAMALEMPISRVLISIPRNVVQIPIPPTMSEMLAIEARGRMVKTLAD